MINITDKALENIKRLIKDGEINNEVPIGIRISINNKGCSGYKYDISYVTQETKLDQKIEKDGVTVYIDPLAEMFIINSTMDWKENKFEEGFFFENPNAKNVCGCGESFGI